MRKSTRDLSLVYRRRQKTDDSFIIRVALQTMKNVFEKSTGIPLSEEMIRQQLDINTTTMVIERYGRPIGYYCYTKVPSGAIYLSALVLSPEAQHKGIGTRVASHIEREARRLGAHAIHAHVQIANTKAIIFWLKNGYQVQTSRINGMLALEKTLLANAQSSMVVPTT
ncbi:MAG: GNAT family N-acetyltransferase [Alicyclobacillus macrosporangiidus]|uniref:GNAT family N-acetyltransferase n=1 Tax=Alicyclobacillus macrosporangiidus TaxID=392015 RepID=UPI0026F1B754|nr:GNAT family N-acetyltransferase [Alicyclobacillus macrosporangiidus]MCL6597742.1 GNAT family N-acetyltransferase [Alicyclobacillus macrosporangiidus]